MADSDNKKITQLLLGVPVATDIMPYVSDPGGSPVTKKSLVSSLFALPTGFLFGLSMSNNVADATNDIDISAGKCRDSTDAADMVLASALTKRLDAAWSVGSNAGGLDTGAIGNVTYHVWLIKRSDTGVVDALFSASATAPTMPANYDYKRRIGSILRESAAIVLFVQDGDKFIRKVPGNVAGSPFTNPGTAAVTRTLLVPVGIRVEALFSAIGGSDSAAAGNPTAVFFSDLSQTDSAPSAASGVFNSNIYCGSPVSNYAGLNFEIMTNTSGQIRSRVAVSTANTLLFINTHGWIDTRGRLA